MATVIAPTTKAATPVGTETETTIRTGTVRFSEERE